ncbi:saccharopine dehydrogenase [Patellaria atrata CBS 101060]|uniref:Saccharopine dehydrogenase n=1 Tax=Patellaria atrata CBS 101060 TaxID=1346257 RepID=A0A9P4VNZ0_9PEZI|nr:saccharopine dehydrogenase [Patellaria atrata CBS 101060]
MATRQYELVLLGATGYTGHLTAEYITRNLPTDLKWAIAGRNEKKLAKIVEDLQSINPDRQSPSIEIAELNKEDLDQLAKKTKLLITTVGPYFQYGEPVIEACAKNGTHYIDCTGESPWHAVMIERFHEIAKSTRAIMIPQCGLDSVPSDMVAYLLASHFRKTLNTGLSNVDCSVHIKVKPSGGTLATLLGIFSAYPLSHLKKTTSLFGLSPVTPPNTTTKGQSFLSKLTGIRNVPGLGWLGIYVNAGVDVAVVGRSWGLLDGGKFYGPDFHFSEHGSTKTFFGALLRNVIMAFGFVLLAIPPINRLVRKRLTQPGQGAEKELWQNDRVRWRAIGHPSLPSSSANSNRAIASFSYDSGIYWLTGLLMAEAAMVILRGQRTLANELGGGLLTPVTLGEQYVDRIRRAGVIVEVERE